MKRSARSAELESKRAAAAHEIAARAAVVAAAAEEQRAAEAKIAAARSALRVELESKHSAELAEMEVAERDAAMEREAAFEEQLAERDDDHERSEQALRAKLRAEERTATRAAEALQGVLDAQNVAKDAAAARDAARSLRDVEAPPKALGYVLAARMFNAFQELRSAIGASGTAGGAWLTSPLAARETQRAESLGASTRIARAHAVFIRVVVEVGKAALGARREVRCRGLLPHDSFLIPLLGLDISPRGREDALDGERLRALRCNAFRLEAALAHGEPSIALRRVLLLVLAQYAEAWPGGRLHRAPGAAGARRTHRAARAQHRCCPAARPAFSLLLALVRWLFAPAWKEEAADAVGVCLRSASPALLNLELALPTRFDLHERGGSVDWRSLPPSSPSLPLAYFSYINHPAAQGAICTFTPEALAWGRDDGSPLRLWLLQEGVAVGDARAGVPRLPSDLVHCGQGCYEGMRLPRTYTGRAQFEPQRVLPSGRALGTNATLRRLLSLAQSAFGLTSLEGEAIINISHSAAEVFLAPAGSGICALSECGDLFGPRSAAHAVQAVLSAVAAATAGGRHVHVICCGRAVAVAVHTAMRHASSEAELRERRGGGGGGSESAAAGR